MSGTHRPLTFGVYPGGEAGSDQGVVSGRPDDAARVEAALRALQGGTTPFVVRAYERYRDADAPSRYPARSPARYEDCVGEGRLLDADSASQGDGDFWHQFGQMRDDYSPKPAFLAYARLVSELGHS